MAGLGATTFDLSRLRARLRDQMEAAANVSKGFGPAPAHSAGPAPAPLRSVREFGSNPGRLEMFTFVPEELLPSPALVVALHGCGQSAAGYAHGAGWTTLAERHGFVLLCPQQTGANNQKSCFNWFLPGDTARGGGEALSIRQMINQAIADHGADGSRVFVTGLSAGGAMTAVMLATYPEVFAGGGIVAGLPFGAAGNVQGALGAMFQGVSHGPRGWGDLVRAASPHRGPWPRVTIWHGDADTVVIPGNAGELVKQWTDVHGLDQGTSERDILDGQMREVWRDATGREAVELVTVAGMGHGTPLETGEGEGACGAAAAFLLDVGISASSHMAAFWGLAPRPKPSARPVGAGAPSPSDRQGRQETAGLGQYAELAAGRAVRRPAEIGATITAALRAAGLLKS